MSMMLTRDLMRQLFPKMSAAQADFFVNRQSVMAEILQSPQRLAVCFANVQVETRGFTVLQEDIHYSKERMAHIWPARFHDNPSEVAEHYGTAPGWQNRAFDDIYGGRMGNRPGTHDGSSYIGRGAPQITGLDGYREIEKRFPGNDFIRYPERMCAMNFQPDIIAAFWTWKRLSTFADIGNITGLRKAWNGGTNGLDTVNAYYPRFLKIIQNYKPSTAVPVAAAVKPATATIDQALVGVQDHLKEFGYHEVGESNGQIGGRTLGAIQAFFNDRGLDIAQANYPSGILITELSKAESEGWHRPIAPGRAFATTTDLAPKVASVAPTQSAGFFAKIGGWFAGATATAKGVALLTPDLNDQSYSYVSFIKSMWSDIPDWVFPVGIVIIAFIIVRKTTAANTATVGDYQQGKIN